MGIGTRISETLSELQQSQAWLADKSGVDEGTISALIVRDSKRSQFTYQLATALGVDGRWLATGIGPKYRAYRLEQEIALYGPIRNNVALVRPMFSSEPDDVSSDFFPYRRDVVDRLVKDEDSLRAYTAYDDSMAPTIWRNDVVLANVFDRKLVTGKIFLIRHPDGTAPRRLFSLHNAMVRIVCDNQDKIMYPDEPLRTLADLDIIARVVHRSGDL